ncbi:MAG TPA: C25 family cysteine peptidase [Alphaproteobacteria bacterium]|nr:C25 family cysteine peptidase [Alphaproteobacteria bacterium]
MTRRSVHSPGQVTLPWHGTVAFWVAATLIAIALQGTVAAATCTNASFAGNTFTVDEESTGQGSGTATVSGCDGDITDVTVTLIFDPNTLPSERDLDLLLVHPNGINNLIIFSEVGNFAPFTGTFTLADSGATCPPQETGSTTGALVSGTTYKPVDYAGSDLEDFGPGAPATQFSAGEDCPGAADTHSFASAFAGLSANGTWTLYAYDDIATLNPNYTVSWSLAITTSTTAVQVESATATPVTGQGVQLRWRTGYEVDNLGFNVYREQGGRRTKLNRSLIAGSALLAGPGTTLTAGRSYAWWDRSTSGSGAARYWLEDIDLNGQRSWHGPIAVGPPAHPSSSPPLDQAQAMPLSSLGRAPAHLRATGPSLRRATPWQRPAPSSARQSLLAAQPAMKLGIRHEGWYRVTQADLVAAGLDPKVDPRLLQLYVDGQEVPVLVTGEDDGRFDAADAVEFYGLGLDEAWTDERVYWLVAGTRAGRRIARVSASGGQPVGNSFPYTVERRDRVVYFPALRNGDRENFFGAVVSQEPVELILPVRHLDPTPSTATLLEVALQGVTSAAHRVHVALNGAGVGEVNFQGQEMGAASLPVSPSWLREGDNRVELSAQAGQDDVSLVDSIRLTYWHTFTADDDALRLSAAGGQRVTIAGFSNAAIRVLDITEADAVREVTGVVQPQDAGWTVAFTVPGSGPKILLALTPARAQSVAAITANQPSRWRRPGQGADLVIISHGDFIDSVEPLKARRQGQGLRVAVVDVEDVYDEFSHGVKSPYAIRDFLRYAVERWAPAPRSALLVGDASLDPKDYLGFGKRDHVPTKLIDTAFMETASDDWLADFNADGLAELAVGRLPVHTAQDAAQMVAKIIGYEQAGAGTGVLLVADRNDAFDFEAANTELRAIIPTEVPTETIERGQVEATTAKSQLFASLERGPALVNYTGHGSVDLWREGLLTASEAYELSNDERLSVFVMMTCLNGYFHDPSLESLAEALIMAEAGAAAVWAPSSLTGLSSQAALNQALYKVVFADSSSEGTSLTLGEAVVRAKAAVDHDDVRRTWILLGDPTMTLSVR